MSESAVGQVVTQDLERGLEVLARDPADAPEAKPCRKNCGGLSTPPGLGSTKPEKYGIKVADYFG